MNIPEKLTEADYYAAQIELSRRSCEYFIEEFVKIEDRDSPDIAIKFNLWDRQKEVLKKFLIKRLLQLLKARQLGLTWLALAYAVWLLIFNPGCLVIALSKKEDDSKELVRRVDFILRYLPRWFLPGTRWKKTTESITLYHFDKDGKPQENAVFQSFPAGPDSGRSFTATLVIIDEWAFQQWAREIWKAAFPTVNRPNGGQVIGISTIERGTLFEEIWRDTKSIFTKVFLPWYTDPRRDMEWYENTKNTMKGDICSEYPATEEEALSIPGGTFFREFNILIHIKQPLPQIPNWYSKYRVMDYGLDTLACYFIYLDGYGFARIYKEIYQEGLVISEAAYRILKESGANVPDSQARWNSLSKEDKRLIGLTCKEKFVCTFAPPDLFAKSSQTGRSSDEIWYENGIALVKSKNDFEQGCIAVADWLHPFMTKDESTQIEYFTARLTIDKDAAPNLVYSLANIQKDKHRPAVYSKLPHTLTHSCLVGDTQIATIYGLKEIRDIKVGDKVLTRKGWKTVLISTMTNENADVYEYTFSNGKKLISTKDHPVINTKKQTPIDSLMQYDTFYILNEEKYLESIWKKSNIGAGYTKDLMDQNIIEMLQGKTDSDIYIETNGEINSERYPKDSISTIKTKIQKIIALKTSIVSNDQGIYLNTPKRISKKIRKKYLRNLKELDHFRQHGIDQTKEESGILSTGKNLGKIDCLLRKNVSFVEANMKQEKKETQSFVQTTANLLLDANQKLMMLKKHVCYAAKNLWQTNIRKLYFVRSNVAIMPGKKYIGKQKVYNLYVEDQHEYFANGILVSNCDALRYYCTEIAVVPVNKEEELAKQQQVLRDTPYPHLLNQGNVNDPDLEM